MSLGEFPSLRQRVLEERRRHHRTLQLPGHHRADREEQPPSPNPEPVQGSGTWPGQALAPGDGLHLRGRSAGVSIFTPSGLIRRRANSGAASTSVALASPTPSNSRSSSARTASPFSSTTLASLAATFITLARYSPMQWRTGPQRSLSPTTTPPEAWNAGVGTSVSWRQDGYDSVKALTSRLRAG